MFAPLDNMGWAEPQVVRHHEVDELVLFFERNVDSTYISHGEIMDGRAIDMKTWHPELVEVFRDDVIHAIDNVNQPDADGLHLVKVTASRGIVAFMLYEFVSTRRNRFVQLHDLVVSKNMRGQGIGSTMLTWLTKQVQLTGKIRHVFIESGRTNFRAHSFFEQSGFQVCSLVMLKELAIKTTPST